MLRKTAIPAVVIALLAIALAIWGVREIGDLAADMATNPDAQIEEPAD
jgi:hypothetical protein